jgi:hypothetical protein
MDIASYEKRSAPDFGRNRIGFPKSQIHSLTAIPFYEFCVSSTSKGYFDRYVQCLGLVFGERYQSTARKSDQSEVAISVRLANQNPGKRTNQKAGYKKKQPIDCRDSHFIRHVTRIYLKKIKTAYSSRSTWLHSMCYSIFSFYVYVLLIVVCPLYFFFWPLCYL